MFFGAFVALAFASNTESFALKKNTVPDECIGNGLCHIKPQDYPQEAIDRLVAQNLNHLQRTKRESDIFYPTDEDSAENNCQVEIVESYQPFTLQKDKENEVNDVIVQSGLFKQIIPKINCKNNGESCFKEFTLAGPVNATCFTKKMTYEFVTYNNVSNSFSNQPFEVDFDCGCSVEHT